MEIVPESKVTSSDVVFCQTNNRKHKNIKFTVIEDQEKSRKPSHLSS